jgi:hypothetical protein
MDHDQRFKALIKEFFRDFLVLFFAAWAERLDLTAPEWLDKEVFPDPPRGKRRVLDLVVKVATRQPVPEQRPGEGDRLLALVHIEIEAEATTVPMRSSLHEAYEHLRRQSQLPVLPLVLYLRVGLNGLGVDSFVERFWDFEVLRFQYLYVGLPALPAEQYRNGDNWLGVALSALMQTPHDERVERALEAIRRVGQSPLNEQQKFLLFDCIEAYAPLDEGQRSRFEQLLQTEPLREIRTMNLTTYDRGMIAGQREALRTLLEGRFGLLSPQVQERIGTEAPERLLELIKAAAQADSLRDLGLED